MPSSKPRPSYKPSLSKRSPEPSSSTKTKSQKAWHKTKKFLSSIGEPPTAEYDRQQLAAGKMDRSKAFRSTDYGACGGGGPYSGGGYDEGYGLDERGILGVGFEKIEG